MKISQRQVHLLDVIYIYEFSISSLLSVRLQDISSLTHSQVFNSNHQLPKCPNNTVVFITGANTGLGYEAIRALYKSSQAYTIFLGCRSVSKGDAAISSLKQEVPNSSSTITSVQADVESDDSIQKALDTISSKHDRVDVPYQQCRRRFSILRSSQAT